MKPHRTHSKEFKLDICRQIESACTSKAAACREHSLAPSMLDRWMEQYRSRGTDAFRASSSEPDKDRRIVQLEQALGQAYLDIKLLKAALEKKGTSQP
jgi:transposase